jgi:hypothetical protein
MKENPARPLFKPVKSAIFVCLMALSAFAEGRWVIPSLEQGNSRLSEPFFSAQPVRFQQILGSNKFLRLPGGGMVIKAMAFRKDALGATGIFGVGEMEVKLSTVRFNPESLSTAFDENEGLDAVVFPRAALAMDVQPEGFSAVVPFVRPFLYFRDRSICWLKSKTTNRAIHSADLTRWASRYPEPIWLLWWLLGRKANARSMFLEVDPLWNSSSGSSP